MSKMYTFSVQTNSRQQMKDITSQIAGFVSDQKVKDGVVIVYCPHTTGGITINENADPAVPHDILTCLDKFIPLSASFYRHAEGNSAAHVKSSLVGACAQVIIEDGKLNLGTWQSIFFCEFDGPRNRRVNVKIIEG